MYQLSVNKLVTTLCKGYKVIRVQGKTYRQHRLAFYCMGLDPPAIVDHINGNRADNSWANLRGATKAQNQHNRKLSRNNKSGVKGVSFDSSKAKWIGSVCKDSKGHFAGAFDTKSEAEEATLKLRAALHGDYACNG